MQLLDTDSAPPDEGLLDLSLARGRDGVTRIVRRAQRFPLHLTAPLYLDPGDRGMAFLYLQNPSGGVFAGDRFRVRVEAGPAARVHLTTPAATRLLRMDGGDARQDVELVLGEGAYVELLPEPVIPHAGARFEQRLEVELAAGAALVAAETLAPGRLARGECFAYERLLFATRVTRSGRELCADTLLLEPRRRSPASRGLLGGFAYLATLLAVAPGRPELVARLGAATLAAPGALAAAGALPNDAGAVVRVLAHTAGAAAHVLELAWQEARETLVGHPAPPRRK